jgi:serine protease AprX
MAATMAASRMPWPAERRFKVKFPDAPSFAAASSLEANDLAVAVANPKRRYFTLAVPSVHAGDAELETLLDERLDFFAASYGADVTEDERWDLDVPPLSAPEGGPGDSPSLDDVLASIGAPEVWASGNKGGGATIAVVDTGIFGFRRELGRGRRAGCWQPAGAKPWSKPWSDPVGHGTMCAVIAAGSRMDGGRFDGVAPEARLVACATRFFDSELAAIYDYLTGLLMRDPGLRLVVTNSFGRRCGSLPSCGGGDFLKALEETIAAGAAVLFSAGNNHGLAGGLKEHCHPCTIFPPKLRSDVFTVGACNLDGEIWDYSSRGPRDGSKPDLVAPVPRDGLVAFGGSDRRFPQGWGTSGACPQAAGLAALLWTAAPELEAAEVFASMRNAARNLGRPAACQGAGRLDCAAAMPGGARAVGP